MFCYLVYLIFKDQKLGGFRVNHLTRNARHVESEKLQREAYYDPFLFFVNVTIDSTSSRSDPSSDFVSIL